MARYTYWQPDEIKVEGTCTCDFMRYKGCEGDDTHLNGTIMWPESPVKTHDCPYCQALELANEPIACSISQAKAWLKERGGTAFTRHRERDGTCFEVTPIVLKGNNSSHKYNRHL